MTYLYPVKAASTGPISTFNGLPTLVDLANLEGGPFVNGDVVLLKDQANPYRYQNGIWVINSTGPWARRSDLSAGSVISEGWAVSVLTGALNAGTQWRFLPDDGSTSAVVGVNNLRFSSVFAGPWPIPIAQGGTGATTVEGVRAALAVPGKFSAAITGTGSAVDFTLTHNLNTEDIVVSIRDTWAMSGYQRELVGSTVTTVDANRVKITFLVAPELNRTYRVTVVG